MFTASCKSSWGLGIFTGVIVAAACDRIGPTLSHRIGMKIGVRSRFNYP